MKVITNKSLDAAISECWSKTLTHYEQARTEDGEVRVYNSFPGFPKLQNEKKKEIDELIAAFPG